MNITDKEQKFVDIISSEIEEFLQATAHRIVKSIDFKIELGNVPDSVVRAITDKYVMNFHISSSRDENGAATMHFKTIEKPS